MSDLDEVKKLAKGRNIISKEVILDMLNQNIPPNTFIAQHTTQLSKILWKEVHGYYLAAVELEERKRERKNSKEKTAFDFMLLDKEDEK